MKTILRDLKLLAIFIFFVGSSVFGAEDHHGAPDGKASGQAKGFKNVSVEEFEKLRADKQNQVLDVRSAKEFAEGHIPGAINIDVNGPDFEKKISALDKEKSYLVHCAAGVRSAKACRKMSEQKFSQLYNLEKGFSAWAKAGKPVEK